MDGSNYEQCQIDELKKEIVKLREHIAGLAEILQSQAKINAGLQEQITTIIKRLNAKDAQDRRSIEIGRFPRGERLYGPVPGVTPPYP